MHSTVSAYAIEEKNKYDTLWKEDYKGNPSKCAITLAKYVKSKTSNQFCKMLDFGCGDGTTVNILRRVGFISCFGVDITLEGVDARSFNGEIQRTGEIGDPIYREAALWDLPYEDDEFDFTFSTDVIEHIDPKFIDAVIDEMFRVTRKRTFHVFANFSHIVKSTELHLCQRDLKWWSDKFNSRNSKELDFVVMNRTDFLANWRE